MSLILHFKTQGQIDAILAVYTEMCLMLRDREWNIKFLS